MKNIVKEEVPTIAEKLKELEKITGYSPQEIAKIGDCSVSTYYRYRSGTSSPDYTFLSKILNSEKNINSDWLMKGTGAVLGSLKDSSKKNTFPEILVPFYKMKQITNNGEGSIKVSDWKSSTESMPICNALLDIIDHKDYDSIFSLSVECDAMYPTIKPGSIVLVNEAQKNITADGIFILKFDNVIRMKLVQKLPNSKVELSTINKKYNSVILNEKDFTDVEVLGKIFWAGIPM
ncbi:XRE family transcriptional regulator [Gracilimonas sp. Q87]|uniref:XRE family transcriptional regulator n=1 Tax=Gracilimonas sp. Q87 TaxID=3384766 RepID=UPI0039845732